MKHTSFFESYSQSQDHSIAEKIKRSWRSEISSRSSAKLQASVDLLNGSSLAVVSIREETSGSSDVLLATFSNKSEVIDQPPLFLGLFSSDVTCGAFATVNGARVCAIGDADGSVTLLSCNKQDIILAKLDCSGSASRPVLEIIQHVYPADSNVVCLWVAYPDSIEQIACNITEGRVAQFIRTLTLKYGEREFGSFHCFEMMDSRFGSDSFLALHFLKISSAVIVPLNALYAHQLCKKILQDGCAQTMALPAAASLEILAPRGFSALHAAINPSSIRTWTVVSPVPISKECDLKILLSSFSFKASALLNNQNTITVHFTTAEQRIVDTIRDLGVEAFNIPDSDVSYSPSKYVIDSNEKGNVLLFQRSEHGDVITALSEALPPMQREMKKNLSPLWKSCLAFRMFTPSREEEVLSQSRPIEDGNLSGVSISNAGFAPLSDREAERIQRMIVMESALAAGLGSLLSEYVLAQADSSNRFSREFLLADVGAIFVWTEGLYRSTDDHAVHLTEHIVVPYLVHRGGEHLPVSTDSMMFDQLIMAASRADLASHISTCDSLTLLLTALYTRKQSSFLSFDQNNDREARLEHESALSVLNRLLVGVKVLSGVIKSILIIVDCTALQLACLLHNPPVGMSLTQLKASRLEREDDMMFMSESICSQRLLYDELVARLHPQVRDVATLPRGAMSPKGGEPLTSSFYSTVARFLWLPLLSVRTVDSGPDSRPNLTPDSASGSGSPGDDLADVYYSAAAAGQSVVLYVLLDALLLSASNGPGPETLCGVLSEAFNMRNADRMRVYSLWRVDSRFDIQVSVEDFCSPSVALWEDSVLFFAVACRLLSYGAKKESKELLTHSASHSGLMRSERGILALTAASVEEDVGQFAWHIARRFCSQLSALQGPDGAVIPRDSVVSSAKRAVCDMLCHWALLNGELGSFLESVMDDEEQDVVFCFLKHLADREVADALLPAPCVDTLVLWLARNRRATKAMEIHDAHCISLRSLKSTEQNALLFRSINLRKVLLDRYLMFPPVPHRALRNVQGRLLDTPIHTHKQFSVYPPETADRMDEFSFSSAPQSSFRETDRDLSFQNQSDLGPDSSVYFHDMQCQTPVATTGGYSFSSIFSDQSFTSAINTAKRPSPQEYSANTQEHSVSDRIDSSMSGIRSSERSTPSAPTYQRNQAEKAFSPPSRPSFPQEQPFSLPFQSATKRTGFLTGGLTGGDVASSASAIREAFQGMTDNFSPVDFSASTGRLPIRRKVRFSEG